LASSITGNTDDLVVVVVPSRPPRTGRIIATRPPPPPTAVLVRVLVRVRVVAGETVAIVAIDLVRVVTSAPPCGVTTERANECTNTRTRARRGYARTWIIHGGCRV
jgi:hypothetical protein|tara:strand:+ start:20370 stop:20687 length:318 start_codon:yes stop_codon:yes gene_type:complete